jgi:hypothetical protein
MRSTIVSEFSRAPAARTRQVDRDVQHRAAVFGQHDPANFNAVGGSARDEPTQRGERLGVRGRRHGAEVVF